MAKKIKDLATGAVNKWMDAFPEWGKVPLMMGQGIRKQAKEIPTEWAEPMQLGNLQSFMEGQPSYSSKYPGIDIDPSISSTSLVTELGNDSVANPSGNPPSIMFGETGPALRGYELPDPATSLPTDLLPPSAASEMPQLQEGGDYTYDNLTSKIDTPKKPLPFGGKKGIAGVTALTGGLLGAGMLGSNAEMAGVGTSPDLAPAIGQNQNKENKEKKENKSNSSPKNATNFGQSSPILDDRALARFLRESAQKPAAEEFRQIGRTPGDNTANEKKNYQGYLNQMMKAVEEMAKENNIAYNPQQIYEMAFTKWQDNNKSKKK